ncbi:MAG: hypothetical protein R2867_46605 [Caldilineaceae bacterium]
MNRARQRAQRINVRSRLIAARRHAPTHLAITAAGNGDCLAGVGWKRAPARDNNHARNNLNDNNGFRVVVGVAPWRSP